jgi:hypothetical protein
MMHPRLLLLVTMLIAVALNIYTSIQNSRTRDRLEKEIADIHCRVIAPGSTGSIVADPGDHCFYVRIDIPAQPPEPKI